MNDPFCNWCQKNKLNEHFKKTYHHTAAEKAYNFIETVGRPEDALICKLDKTKLANIERNHKLLKSTAEAVLFCSRQCIGLRGDNEKLNSPGNPGNFLSILKLIANHDKELHDNLESPRMKNANTSLRRYRMK